MTCNVCFKEIAEFQTHYELSEKEGDVSEVLFRACQKCAETTDSFAEFIKEKFRGE